MALGKHIIIDLYGASNLDSVEAIEQAMMDIIAYTGATLLHQYYHTFEPHGVTGFTCLAESHISIHTWPETGAAAFDIFMCGDSEPELAIPLLERHFSPITTQVTEIMRLTADSILQTDQTRLD